MSGTLTFWENHIPKEGELVYIFVDGKGFPSGVWKGILTSISDVGESHIVPTEEMSEYHSRCIAEIVDDRTTICRNKEPIGRYDVYPDAPGMGKMLNKLFEQKAEVRAQKKEIELRKKFLIELVQIVRKGLGIEIDAPK